MVIWNPLTYMYANGQKLARIDATGSVEYFHNDYLGSARRITNSSGSVVWSREYRSAAEIPPAGNTKCRDYPFGETEYGTGAVTEFQFSSKERDATGLYYFGARSYDPTIGRWLSVDPLAGMYPGWSPYVYALDNPLIYTDPTGTIVEFDDEEQAIKAADELNALHEGANITVEQITEEHSLLGLFTWTTTTYQLSISESEFDWSQDKYTKALSEVITSREIKYNVMFDSSKRGVYDMYDIGGIIDSYKGGADIAVYPGISRTGERIGVVLLHELLGHGHPVGDLDANDINRFYNEKLNFYRKGYHYHGGYYNVIGW